MSIPVHKIVLSNDRSYGKRIPAEPLGEFLAGIPELARGAVRMALQGTSSVRGKRPDWLYRAADIRLVEVAGADDTELYFEVPRLGEAAEDVYAQTEMFDTRPSGDCTAFDLLAGTVKDIHADNPDSMRFDAGLLSSVAHLDKTLDPRYFQYATIFGHGDDKSAIARLDDHLAAEAKKLYRMTPEARQVRVSGELDMIRASTQTFSLKLDSGETVWGTYQTEDFTVMGAMFRQRVTVLGKASFRPSGHVLRIDADEVLPANEADSFFSRLPVALRKRSAGKLVISPTAYKGKGGIKAIFGKWPGDETDEEIEEILREIS